MNWLAFLKLVWSAFPLALQFIKGVIREAGRREGRAEVVKEQREAGDALRKHYDQIADDDRGLGGALGGLRDRAASRDRGLPGASSPDDGGGRRP